MAKPKPPKVTGPRKKDETAYHKAIQKSVLTPLFTKITGRLESVPLIKAAYINAVDIEIKKFVSLPGFGESTATAALDNLRNTHKAQMIKSFGSALGIDIGPSMSDLNIRPLMNQALLDNVALIKSIPNELNLQIVDAFSKVDFIDQQQMIGVLKNRFNVADTRAKFITRDQTGKIIGDLNKARQTDLGIRSYLWQTSEDELVVGTPGGTYPVGNPGHMNHFIRNKVEFLWTAPPPDGQPGQPFN